MPPLNNAHVGKSNALAKFAVFTIAGALVSVLVACACAIWLPLPYGTKMFRQPSDADVSIWQTLAPAGATPVPVAVRPFDAVGGVSVFVAFGDHSGTASLVDSGNGRVVLGSMAGAPVDRVIHVRSGWPLKCLEGERWDLRTTLATPIGFLGERSGSWAPADEQRGCVSLHRPSVLGGRSLRLLPYRPVPHLLALNSAFFAIVLALGLWACRRTRAIHRRFRGRCPNCAYPQGASPVCSECGFRLVSGTPPDDDVS